MKSFMQSADTFFGVEIRILSDCTLKRPGGHDLRTHTFYGIKRLLLYNLISRLHHPISHVFLSSLSADLC